jgi:hypothetical protein
MSNPGEKLYRNTRISYKVLNRKYFKLKIIIQIKLSIFYTYNNIYIKILIISQVDPVLYIYFIIHQ